MATKTKPKKKQAKAKKTTNRKKTAAKSSRKTAAKKTAKTKIKTKAKTKTRTRKAVAKRRAATKRKVRAKRRRSVEPQGFSVRKPRGRTDIESGDLEGLSRTQGADSESVAELLGEGNTFEADVISGVEAANDLGEVRTREVPEDDVPDEYLDNE